MRFANNRMNSEWERLTKMAPAPGPHGKTMDPGRGAASPYGRPVKHNASPPDANNTKAWGDDKSLLFHFPTRASATRKHCSERPDAAPPQSREKGIENEEIFFYFRAVSLYSTSSAAKSTD